MIYLGCKVDYWRNFVSYAPNIHIVMRSTIEPVFVDLTPYLIQGAVQIDDRETLTINMADPNNPKVFRNTTNAASYTGKSPIAGVLDKIPVERGWYLNYVQLNSPSYGITYPKPDKTGFYYKAGVADDFQDCFNYYFDNGTQRSNIAQVLILSELPFASDVALDLTYTMLGSSAAAVGDASLIVDKDLSGTTYFQSPLSTAYFDFLPNITGTVRNMNLILTGFKIYYVMPNKPRGYTVYNWDGSSFYQVISSGFAGNPNNPATSTLAAFDTVNFTDPVPLYNGYPEFRIKLDGTYSQSTEGNITIVEIVPIISYSPPRYENAITQYIAKGWIEDATS